ncbi:hypothetical protein [Asanoa siamensis]|uniref:Uncharacterized protein n=1 Tax=Asanoa siamensis TaxID=926357 RepID=A0ABQ4CQL2_9ACTN|nr:hypothetical protein [Asanoa siamensis]GIF73570.1 hypothetical protein Asi02nite_30880 [Asanoa siamensis]
MSSPTVGSTSRVVTSVALVAGAAGIFLQGLAGVDMPAVPPGAVMLIVAAALIALTRWGWAPILGVVVASAEVAALAATGALADLTDPSAMGIWLATWVRTIGVASALVAGVVAIVSWRRAVSRARGGSVAVGASR